MSPEVQEKPRKHINKHIAFELYIQRKKEQIKQLRNIAFGVEEPKFEKSQSYEYFYR